MLRNAASGVFLFIGILVIRDYGWKLGPVLGLLSSLTAATYTICTQSWFDWHSVSFFWVVRPFCILGPVHIWLFSLSQFQDDFRLKPVHLILAAAYLLLTQIIYLPYEMLQSEEGASALYIVFSLLRFGFIVHMLYVAWQGRADDLLEARRQFRTIYVLLVGFVMTVIFVQETFFSLHQMPYPLVSFVQALSFFVLSFVIFWQATKMRGGILLIRQTSGERQARVEARGEIADSSDQLDLEAIERLVVAEKMYLEPGLTISKLADNAKLPEHRLRRLINQHMGYRNFADFLNRYRIEEAKIRLADGENRHTQILVIAMDLGYGSLGPFNRAFKARTGQTPTEYRKNVL